MNNLIGVTGKMASGKTTLMKLLEKDNPDFIYVDVDLFRRSLFRNQEYVQELKNFILEIRDYDEIDSSILNSFIYNNEKYMNYYKTILYKYLFDYLCSFNDKTIVVEWALILQDNLIDKFDKIIYVKASDETIFERLIDCDLSTDDLQRRFQLQNNILLDDYLKMDNFLAVDLEKTNISDINSFIRPMECKFSLPNHSGKAIWEITHQCNYQCSYCIFSCNFKKEDGELTTDECFHVIDELEKNGFKYLKITGGEPFLRKDIIDILEYASRKMITDISTNASFITENMVNELNKIPLKMIHVSLDGNLEEHESVRGKNTYNRTIQGLKYLQKSKNKVRIGSVIHKKNENTLNELIKSAEELAASEIIFSIMEPVRGQDLSQIRTKSNEELISELEMLKKKYSNICISYNFGSQPNYVCSCPAGSKFIYINHLGQISPCTWVYEKDNSFISRSSLKESSLVEVMNEDILNKFIKQKKKGICYGKI